MKIGIDLGGTGLKTGVFDNGVMVRKSVKPSPGSAMGFNESIECIFSAIKEFGISSLEGIGVGVPSVVDASKGIVYDAVNIPSWKCVPLRNILRDEFHTVVKVNNDANCFALGELKFGAARGCRDVVGITLGTGLGTGVITDGKLYNGANTGAGELGNAPYLGHTYEYWCSSSFFSCEHATSGLDLFNDASAGAVSALEIWNEFGCHLGEFIKLVLYAYDPQMIVLGGSIAKAYQFFMEPMRRALDTFIYQNSLKNLVIIPSEVEDAGIKGAVALLG